MSRHEQFLQRILGGRSDASVRFDELGGLREWPGEILPSMDSIDAVSLLQHLVSSYSDSIASGSFRVRAEDDYNTLGTLEHLYQVNATDADGNTFDGFVREATREWTTRGTWLSLVLEQDAGILSRAAGTFRFGVSTFGSQAFLWI